MGNYDYFIGTPNRPEIDPDLLVRSREAGIRQGHAVSSPFKALVDGILGGVKTGQEIIQNSQKIQDNQHTIDRFPVADQQQDAELEQSRQQNTIRANTIEQLPVTNQQQQATLEQTQLNNKLDQHTVDRFPVADQRQDEALAQDRAKTASDQNAAEQAQLDAANRQKKADADRAEADATVKRLEAEIAVSEQSMVQSTRAAELKAKADLQKKQAENIKTKAEFNDKFASHDPAIVQEVFDDPRFQGIAAEDKEFREYAMGRLSQTTTDPDRLKAINRFKNLNSQLEMESRERKLQAEVDAADAKELVEHRKKLRAGNLSFTADFKDKDVARMTYVLEDAVKVDRKTGVVTPKDPSKIIQSNGASKYIPLLDGKRVGINTLTSAEVGLVKNFASSWKASVGRPRGEQEQQDTPQETPASTPSPTPAPAPAPTATATPAPRDLGALSKDLERTTGVPAGVAKSVVDRAFQQGQGKSTPDAWAAMAGGGMRRDGLDQGLQAAESAGVSKANETIQAYNKADAPLKKKLEEWAERHDTKMDGPSLQKFFTTQAKRKLTEAHAVAREAGIEDRKAGEVRDRTRAAAQKERAAVEDAAGIGPPGVGAPPAAPRVSVKDAAQKVGEDYGLSPERTKNLQNLASRVQKHELLKNESSDIQAIAAIESSGGLGGKSKTGVRGILQVTGPTAADYGMNPDNESENYQAGKMHLAMLRSLDFGKNDDMVFAAYNVGQGTIKEARKHAKDPDDWNSVLPHVYDAIVAIKKRGRTFQNIDPLDKYKEVMNYTGRVKQMKQVFELLKA